MSAGILVIAVRVRVLSSSTIGRDAGLQSRRAVGRKRYEGALRKITAWASGQSEHRPAVSLYDAFTFDMQSYVIEYNGIFEHRITGDRERIKATHPELRRAPEPEPRLIIVDPERPEIVILESGPICKVKVEDASLAYVTTINSMYEVCVKQSAMMPPQR